MSPKSVSIYSTPTCPYCAQAKQYLKDKSIPYTDIDVSSDEKARQEMIDKSGQMGVPVIVVDDQMIVGFDRGRLEQLLT